MKKAHRFKVEWRFDYDGINEWQCDGSRDADCIEADTAQEAAEIYLKQVSALTRDNMIVKVSKLTPTIIGTYKWTKNVETIVTEGVELIRHA